MNDFEKGMTSIGQLHPAPFPYSDYPPPNNAWKEAANSFRQAGNSLRFAINNLLNADASFPERIMRMAEARNAADIVTKNRISLSNLIVPIIGQAFTLILGVGSIAACIYLAQSGYTGAAIAAIAGGFSPMIISAFKNLRQGRK